MKIKVNGDLISVEVGTEAATLQKIIEELGHSPELIVVEFNGKILTSNFWGEQIVTDGDILEIVTIVGGGDN